MKSFVVFLIAFTVLPYSKAYGQADDGKGIKVVAFPPETAYDDLPEEIRNRIPRHAYEQPPTSTNVTEAEKTKLQIREIYRRHFNSINNSADTFRKVRANSIVSEIVGVTKEQDKEIGAWLSRWEKLSNEMSKLSNDEQNNVRKQLILDARQILLPHQYLELGNLSIRRIGLPKLLVNGFVGEAIEMSEQQKRALKLESQRLADEIEDLIRKQRSKLRSVLLRSLTRDQKEELEKLFPPTQINSSFDVSLESLYQMLNFKNNSKSKRTPAWSN